MISFDAKIKILDTEIFPQHTIADVNWALLLLFCSVRRSLYVERKYTHTHTHTHTHTGFCSVSTFSQPGVIFFCMSSVGKMNISLTILVAFQLRKFRKNFY